MALFSMELASCIASISNTTTLVLTKKKNTVVHGSRGAGPMLARRPGLAAKGKACVCRQKKGW